MKLTQRLICLCTNREKLFENRVWFIKGKVSILVLCLIICFIWINSMMTSRLSNEFSNSIVKLLGGTVTHSKEEATNATTLFNSENVRKLAHFLEYLALGCAAMVFKLKFQRKLVDVLCLGLGIAVVDETIQLFDGRTSMIKDVWIDMAGFFCIAGGLDFESNIPFDTKEKRNSRVKSELKYKKLLIVLIILTLCFIWGNSLMPASVSGTFSEKVKDLINILLGHAGSGETFSGDGVLRKIAHATEFGLPGMEVTLLFQDTLKEKLTAITLCGLSVAVMDETIQLFSEGRAGLIKDVWIDFSGFTLGVLLIWVIRKIKSRVEREPQRL